jgi:glycopeptide antibiotics resistance protein/uncharacterized RDD family membrane protein YckC
MVVFLPGLYSAERVGKGETTFLLWRVVGVMWTFMIANHSVNGYVQPIIVAFVGFPVISLLMLIPFAYTAYRRYGQLPMWRTFVFFTFLYYIMAMFLFTILPLPAIKPGFCKLYQSDTIPQLQPLAIVKYIADTVQPLTFWSIVKSFGFFQIVGNILLFLPLGVYLRYYFERSFPTAIVVAFGVSFLLEMTQLTGIWHIYPCPYRLFDVDDILTNTIGGMVGYGFMVAVEKIRMLPAVRPNEAIALQKGEVVRVTRRLVAWVIDGTVVYLGTLLIFIVLCSSLYSALDMLPPSNALPLIQHSLVFVAALIDFVVIPILWNGVTIGKYVVALEMVSQDHRPLSVAQILRNYSVLVLPVTLLDVLQGVAMFLGLPTLTGGFVSFLQILVAIIYVLPMLRPANQQRQSLGRLVSHTTNKAMHQGQLHDALPA